MGTEKELTEARESFLALLDEDPDAAVAEWIREAGSLAAILNRRQAVRAAEGRRLSVADQGHLRQLALAVDTVLGAFWPEELAALQQRRVAQAGRVDAIH